MKLRLYLTEYDDEMHKYVTVKGCAMVVIVADRRDLLDVWIAAEDAIIKVLAEKRQQQNDRDLTGG